MFGSKKLFGNTISPSCSYCQNGSLTTDGSAVLCQKKGVVSPGYSCRKFVYDPLKRVPMRRPKLPQFKPSDFEL